MKDHILAKDWIAAIYSQDIGSEPVPVTILEERVVFFRTRDGVQAFKDLCIHRGAALSLGKVADDCIVCPYHGWKYDAEGKCVKIPQQPAGQTIPPKAKAVVYSCTEQYGIIWVKLDAGSGNEAPVPFYEEYEDPTFQTVHAKPYILHATAPRVVENFLDASHLAFVHDRLLGDSDFPEIPHYSVYWHENRYVSDEIAIYADADGSGNYATIYYTFEILRPMTARLKKVNYENKQILSMLFTALPHKERKTTVFALISRNYALDQSDEYFRDFQKRVIEQDAGIVALSAFCQAVKISFEEVAARRGLMLILSQWMNAEPVMMDVELTRMVEHICMHRNLSFLSMFSGAGHDTQVMQSVCPTALVFVPSRGGISHSPDEYTSTKELATGVSVLTDFLYVLAYDRGERFENVS